MKTSITQESKKTKICKALGALVFWLLVWQAAAWGVGQELLLPAPVSVAKEMWNLVKTLFFWQSAGLSLLRVFSGFVFGVILGVFLAVITYRSKVADALVSPLIRVVRATPVASFIILTLLWIGHSLMPAFISALMVTPIMWANCLSGIQATDENLLEMSKAYRFKPWKIIKLIYIPSILPHFYSGIITSLGMAWKSGIAAEILSLPKLAIGTQVYYSKIYLESASLFAWTFVIIVLSYALEKIFVTFVEKIRKKRGGLRV